MRRTSGQPRLRSTSTEVCAGCRKVSVDGLRALGPSALGPPMKSSSLKSPSLGVDERRRRRLEALAGCRGSTETAAGRPEDATGLQTEDRSGKVEAEASGSGGGVASSDVWLIADGDDEDGTASSSHATGGSLEGDEVVEVSIIKEREDTGADKRLGLVLSTSADIPQLHVSVIRDGGLAALSMLREGDRVLEVNGVSVHHAEEATALMMQVTR